MQTLSKIFSIFALISLSGLCYATGPKVIVNTTNRAILSSVDLGQVLAGSLQYWENGEAIVIAYVKGDKLSEKAVEEHTGMNAQRYKQHWKRAVFTGRGNLPRQFQTTKEVIDFVFKTPGAVAIIEPQGQDLATVRVLPVSNMAFSGINRKDPVLLISKPEEKPLGY